MKELLHLIFWIACKAYWKDDNDCGGDFDEHYCKSVGCKHYDICDWQQQFINGYNRLK